MRRAKDRERPEEAIEKFLDSHFDQDGHWNEPSMKEMSEPEHALHNDHISRFIQTCLENLTIQLRTAFTLKEMQGIDTRAVCERMALTPNNLGVILFRAGNQLRECLKAKG